MSDEDVIDGVCVIDHEAIEMFRVRLDQLAEQYDAHVVGPFLDDAATNIRQLLAEHRALRQRLAEVEGERDEAKRLLRRDWPNLTQIRSDIERATAEAIAMFIDRDTENTASRFVTPRAFGTQLAADIRASAWRIK